MSLHSEKAKDFFESGYNCCQAVVAAFAKNLNIENLDLLLKLSSSFGGGMGRLREVCGAVSGMFIVAGIVHGYCDVSNPDLKKEHYKLIQKLGHKFKDINGSMICRELLQLKQKESSPIPSERNKEYYNTRPCTALVMSACDILDEILSSNLNNIDMSVEIS